MTLRKLHPTGLVPECLSARVLDFMNGGELGLLALASAAELVAADCRNNEWVLVDVKRAGLSDAAWLQFLEQLEAVDERATAAMTSFAVNKDQEQLCAAFVDVAAKLNDRSLPRSR